MNKLILYKTVIRPKITYASPVWINTATTNINKLQVIQNKILKCIHGVPRNFPTAILHDMSGIGTLNEVICNQAKNFNAKCKMSRFELIRQLAT